MGSESIKPAVTTLFMQFVSTAINVSLHSQHICLKYREKERRKIWISASIQIDICSPNFKTSEQQLEVFTFLIIISKRKWCWELRSPANLKVHMIQIQRRLQNHLIKPYAKLPSSQMLTFRKSLCGIWILQVTAKRKQKTLPHVKRLNIFLLTKIVTWEIGWYFFSLKIC